MVEMDETWTIVKVHGLQQGVTAIGETGKLATRDVDITRGICPDLKREYGSLPETGMWSDTLCGDLTAVLRLTSKSDKLARKPKNITVPGVRASLEYPQTRTGKHPICKRRWKQHNTKDCKA